MKAGISVVEFREYTKYVDVVVDRVIDPKTFRELYSKLLSEHSVIMFQLRSEIPIVRLIPYRPDKSRLYKFRWILTSITVVTVFLTGFALSSGLHSALGSADGIGSILLDSTLYTVVFLVSLMSHELGHLIVSKRSEIKAEGPILIPAPPLQLGFIGTLGAVILTRTPPCTKKDLARLGLVGPLLGFIASLLFGLIGVHLSPVVPESFAEKLIEEQQLSPLQVASLSFYLLTKLKSGGVLIVHPVLFSSYVIHLVTFLNLLPIGQLDGGHIVRSVAETKAFKIISTATPLALIATGIALSNLGFSGFYYTGVGLITLILYAIIGRRGHPGTANQHDASRCSVCIILYIVLLILTAPIPIT